MPDPRKDAVLVYNKIVALGLGMIKLTLSVLMLLTAARAEAQTPSTATPLAREFAAKCEAEPVLAALTLRYNQAFQREARALLDALRGAKATPSRGTAPPAATCVAPDTLPQAARDALDYSRHHVALVWIGTDALGTTQLMRANVRWPEPAAYSADLPGVLGLTEVFVAGSVSARAASLYTSTAENDPLVEQLPGFVQAIFAPLSATVTGILGRVEGKAGARSFEEAVAPPQLVVTISSVVLPLARASIHLRMEARDLVTVEEFTSGVGELGAALIFDGAGRSTPARVQVAKLVDDLPIVAAGKCAASGSVAPAPVACRNELDAEIKAAYDAAMAKKPSTADAEAIEWVDKQFRELVVNALSVSATLNTTLKNRPLTHFAFGAGAAVMPYARVNRVRTKLDEDSGVLASDPLPRVMTMAFVNWSPRGYDEASPTLRASERFRGFLGAALTPDFGVVGGINVLLQRGIGIVGGVGLLFGNGAEPEEVGTPPAPSQDPFKLAVGRTAFVASGYNYK
jgi:hypothetical protein